ncbi:molybdopterin-guanine dinucleotide biosynthesis protein B [Neobacillus bataviensis LMG 21833]|uniref:Molybdopterin-guanine dinucleotide biosynthesis protein B n=1 Tax=Neobacillus bataviensis LMG 21833 TaxID=1117379 RepID=K6DBE3_9BACI|nr:molybdopterin-guanine dinucleotide biosynthesis protein B [Neobacillus bataviensis]EKN65388.1 molybdopterin-guanine dinucleotide biosynthesis protein B [Neobacillus bataviensis LMG 21833]
MALVRPVIFQVVGYQNSGKTTITSKLIETLTIQGLKTVTIKHHGHGGRPDVAGQKDSTKHLSAGAVASLVEGGGRLILHAEQCEYGLNEQIELMQFFHPDVILVEGYKWEGYPKLLLISDKQDLPLVDQVNNVQAVVYWKEEMNVLIYSKLDVPSFHISDEAAIGWAVEFIEKLVPKMDEKE